jgi:glycosyltransferase involved in cell wall biosynthesis
MSEQPVVTVLMSAFNDAAFLSEAVESILRQTFGNFEFLVIDDGSTDGSARLLAAVRDPRMRVVRNEEHLGLTRSLKTGVELARGQYIARMDADDVALPERLEKQVALLMKRPEIGILGSACYIIDQVGREVGLLQMPEDDLQIHWTSLLANPFAHPTIMFRRDVLISRNLNYDEAFQTTQDYDLWMRMLRYTCGANLGEPLMRYRTHGDRVTNKFREVQLRNHDIVALRTMQEQLPDFAIPSEQVSQLRELFVGGSGPSRDLQAHRATLAATYLDLLDAFVSHHPEEPGLQGLQRQEALKVARLVFRWPLQPGCVRIGRRLMAMHPGLPWSYSVHLWNAVCRRLRPRTLNSAPLRCGWGQSGDRQNNRTIQQRL